MNCTDFQNQIDEYSGADLSPEAMADFEGHLASCLECTRAVAEHKSLLASLKAMPVFGPPEGFAERVLRVAVATEKEQEKSVGQHVDHHRRGFMVGFGSAAVAALALWVVVGVFPQQPVSGTSNMAKVEASVKESIPEFSIALNHQRDIKLAFFSSEDLKDAQITLRLPENVALVGYEGQRELVWETNLVRGDNTLRLPIIATSVATGSSGGQLVAHIEYKGKVRTLKVNLAIGEARGAPDLSGSTGLELQVV